MCTCNKDSREEYHTALSEFETSLPENHRTSTRYYEESIPEYSSTPKRTIQRDYQRIPRTRLKRTLHRPDLTSGVAIVPRRIDFDAISEVEDIDVEEDMGELTRETLERSRSPAQRPIFESTRIVAPETYRSRRTRATQYPASYIPRMVQITPCGKCLRI